jgi:hypothetical protein
MRQPYVHVKVDKKGREREVDVHLDERDPVYRALRGLELTQVSEKLERDINERQKREKAFKAKVLCLCLSPLRG